MFCLHGSLIQIVFLSVHNPAKPESRLTQRYQIDLKLYIHPTKHIRQGMSDCSQEYKSLSGKISAFLLLFWAIKDVPIEAAVQRGCLFPSAIARLFAVICLKQSLWLLRASRAHRTRCTTEIIIIRCHS